MSDKSKYETQESWVKQWEEEQLAKLIEETKQYIKNTMIEEELENVGSPIEVL